MDKKGKINLTSIAIGVIILGLVATIGANVLINMRNTRTSSLDTISVVNETFTTVNEVAETFANGWVNTVSQCVNSTSGEVIGALNYTVTTENSNFGTATIAVTAAGGASEFNNSNWQCTYTRFNTSRADWDLPNQAVVGLGEYGNWFNIIVIVGVAALILTLIFLAFGGLGGRGGKGGASGAVSY